MANFKYFADMISGQTVELTNVAHDGHNSTAASHFIGRGPNGEKLQATRKVVFKSNPSRHECDARCINATGRIMNCECSCGGKNHGKGAFNCEAVAA